MNYSTYRQFWVAAWVLFAALLGLVFLLVSPFLCVLGLAVFAVSGYGLYKLHFALLQDRLDSYDGRFPNPTMGLGMWGFDIVDDRPAAGDASSSTASRSNRRRHGVCPYCQTIQRVGSSKFCHECGKPLAPPPPPSPRP